MRGVEAGARAAGGKHLDFEVLMEHELVASTDPIEEAQRFTVASHQDVLAVVDQVAGLRILERVGASAERGLAFEQGDAESALGQRDARAQAGESAADYDDVFGIDH